MKMYIHLVSLKISSLLLSIHWKRKSNMFYTLKTLLLKISLM